MDEDCLNRLALEDELLSQLLELTDECRCAFLEQISSADPELRERLMRLITFSNVCPLQPGGGLKGPVAEECFARRRRYVDRHL